MKNNKLRAMMALGMILMVSLSACSTKTPTPDLAKINTMIAQTVAVKQTQTEVARPTNTPTPQPTPTNTPLPPTATPSPTLAVSTTPVVTRPAGGTDAGAWASSNPADKTPQTQGMNFKVLVKFLNTGTSTWTTDYTVRYMSGDLDGPKDSYNLSVPVPPGAIADVTIELTAPAKTGMLRGDWALFNSAGTPFAYFYFEYDIR